jgi:hypothetical protein
MFTTNSMTRAAVGLALCCGLSGAFAASGSVQGLVSQVMVTADKTYGGCMAALAVNPQTVLPACKATWVTMGCTGELNSGDVLSAFHVLDQAQLAYATKRNAKVWFRDDKMVSGYCYAYRIDVQ